MTVREASKPISIRRTASAGVVLVLTVIIGLFAWISLRTVNQDLIREHHASASAMARSLALAVEVPVATGDKRELVRIASGFRSSSGLASVMIRSAVGDTLVYRGAEGVRAFTASVGTESAERRWTVNDPICAAAASIRAIVATDDDLSSFDTESAESTGATEATAASGSVVVGLSMEPLRAAIESKTWQFGGVFVGCVGAFTPMVWFMVGGMTRRLEHLVAAAERISVGEVDFPVASTGRDEITMLATVFEKMRLAVRDRNQQLQEFASTLQDQVNERTRDLESAMHAAQAANRAKSDFLANMSHEIRTPMNAILGFTETLAEPDQTPEERASCLRTIARSGNHLLGIINDILDVSKIEAGKMTAEIIPSEPCRLIAESVDLLRHRAVAKGITLTCRFATPIPGRAATDAGKYRQILVNLIGNAIKFTEKGSVEVVAAFEGNGGEGLLRVSVKDSGVGIHADAIKKLFTPFEQGDGSMSRRFGGTGLGLTIARSLAVILGGDIRVESRLGHGATFTCEIRLAGPISEMVSSPEAERIAEDEAPKAGVPISLRGRIVLLVEDGDDNARLVMHHLTKAGATVERAADGQLGVELYSAMQTRGQSPHIILMDMQMPVMDGYTATALLREMDCQTPIVALTAHSLAGDRAKCLDAGCNDYITKPVNRETLLSTVAKWETGSVRRIAA